MLRSLAFAVALAASPAVAQDVSTFQLDNGMDVVVVDDDSAVPDEYQRVAVAPDKALIKKALKDGCEVPGCHLGKGNSSVRIK